MSRGKREIIIIDIHSRLITNLTPKFSNKILHEYLTFRGTETMRVHKMYLFIIILNALQIHNVM